MKNRISFRDIKTQADVTEWLAGVEERWPARKQVAQHISKQIRDLPFPTPRVLELCPGPGGLAEVLLTTHPTLAYLGIDFSEPLLAFAQNRLAPYQDRAHLIQANLNQDDWPGQLAGELHAVVSMQSLHDLGGEAEVNRIYGLVHDLLTPGGLFLNADLIVAPGEELANNPGRRSVPRHLELLQNQGYAQVVCTLEIDDFGCFAAVKGE